MKNFFNILLLFFAIGCTQSNEEKLEHINGYWEIAQIETIDGQVREYGMSQNIDFFQIDSTGKGIRKKVQPDALGSFTTSQASENIDVYEEGGSLKLQYTTSLDTWIETVKKATNDELILVNETGITYTYRKYKPLVLD